MKLLFDIGCNAGHWIYANYNEGTRIIGLEPDPVVHARTALRFANTPNIDILNVAASDKDGSAIDFYRASTDWASTASIEFKEKGRFAYSMTWAQPFKVPTITIDTIISAYGEPDFIKIDVEGYELTALKGLTHKSGMIAFEWNEEAKSDTLLCVAYCASLGYDKFAIIHEDEYTFIPSAWCDYDTFVEVVNKELDALRMTKWGMIYCN